MEQSPENNVDKEILSILGISNENPKSSSLSNQKLTQKECEKFLVCPHCNDITVLKGTGFCRNDEPMCGRFLANDQVLKKALSECADLPRRRDKSAKFLVAGKWVGGGILSFVVGSASLGMAIADIYDPSIRAPGTLIILLSGCLLILLSTLAVPIGLIKIFKPISAEEFVSYLKLKNMFLEPKSAKNLESYLIPSQREDSNKFYTLLHKALKKAEHKLFCLTTVYTPYRRKNYGTVTVWIHEGTKREHKPYAKIGLIAVQSKEQEWYLMLPELALPDSWILFSHHKTSELSRQQAEWVGNICQFALKGDIHNFQNMLANRPELLNMEDSDGNSPLTQAAAGGHKDIVEFLITSGADINRRSNKSGETPLHSAAIGKILVGILEGVCLGHKEVAELLISKGANIHARNNEGWTVLHSAVLGSNIELVELLINLGLDVNAKIKDGDTPLHIAAKNHCDIEIVSLLISKGADPNIKGYGDCTPLQIASISGNQETTDMLERCVQ